MTLAAPKCHRSYRPATVMERTKLLPLLPNRDSDGADKTPAALPSRDRDGADTQLLPPLPNRDSDGADTTPAAVTEPRQ